MRVTKPLSVIVLDLIGCESGASLRTNHKAT